MPAPTGHWPFTMIELMIVVIIIGALAIMIVPHYMGQSEHAKTQISSGEIRNLSLALDLYKLNNGFYPSTAQGLQALMTKPTDEPVPASWTGPYLQKLRPDPWKRDYKYKNPGTQMPGSYDLYSVGIDGVEGTDDDIGNWQ